MAVSLLPMRFFFFALFIFALELISVFGFDAGYIVLSECLASICKVYGLRDQLRPLRKPLPQFDSIEWLVHPSEDINHEPNHLPLCGEKPIVQIHDVCMVVDFHNVEFAHLTHHSTDLMQERRGSEDLFGGISYTGFLPLFLLLGFPFPLIFLSQVIEVEAFEVLKAIERPLRFTIAHLLWLDCLQLDWLLVLHC